MSNLQFGSAMRLFVAKFTAQALHRFNLVNLVDFSQGVGEIPCMTYYLGNVGSLFYI